MHCSIDGAPVPASSIAVRAMNFSQPIAGLTPRSYETRVTVDELLASFSAKHDQWMRDLIADEPYDDGTDDVTNDLRAAGWPPLAELVRAHPRLFERYAARMVELELLNALFHTSALAAAFQLNTLDSVRLEGEEIVLTGLGYGKLAPCDVSFSQ